MKQGGKVDIELRMQRENTADDDGDQERDREPGLVHALTLHAPARRPANSQ